MTKDMSDMERMKFYWNNSYYRITVAYLCIVNTLILVTLMLSGHGH